MINPRRTYEFDHLVRRLPLPHEKAQALDTLAVAVLNDSSRTSTSTDPNRADEAEAEGPGPEVGRERLLVDERRRVRPATRERAAIYWFLALFALVSVLTTIHQLTFVDNAGVEYSESVYHDAREVQETIIAVLQYVQTLCGAGLVVCWLIWFARVHAVAEQFAPGRLRHRPSMAVAGWFIPVGNLFLPKQIADDVWHASSPSVRSGGPAPTGLLHTWWAAWLVTFLTSPLLWASCTGFLDASTVPHSYSYELDSSFWLLPIAHVLVVPAAVITALYVRRMTAMQRAKLGASLPRPVRPPD